MDEDYPEFPHIGGSGSLHDLHSEEPEPRLWRMKSVSQAAAIAMAHKPKPVRRPMGFHLPSAR